MTVIPRILVLGKLPPPYIGPAVATEILLKSSLKNYYDIAHVNTNVHHKLHTIGRFSIRKVFKNCIIYFQLVYLAVSIRPRVVLIPISQSTLGFVKDSLYILLCFACRCRPLLHLRGSSFNSWVEGSRPVIRGYVRWVLRRACGVIVLGDNLRYLFKEYFPDDRIFVVPNGANISIPNGERRRRGRVKLLYLSNMQPSKGIEDVLSGVLCLEKRLQQSCELVVAGAWRDVGTKEKCMKMVANATMPITFYGPAYGDEKKQLLTEADIFVFTPREPEGHPWVIVEALAAGLPIISTDKGAIRESVIHGQNGYIVHTNAPQEIAARISALVDDSDRRLSMSIASRHLYEERYTEEIMIQKLRKAIDTVIVEA